VGVTDVAWVPGEGGLDVDEQLRGLDLYRPPPDPDRDAPLARRPRPWDAEPVLLALGDDRPPAGPGAPIEVAWAVSVAGNSAGVPEAPGSAATPQAETAAARATDAAFLLLPDEWAWGRGVLLAVMAAGTVVPSRREPRPGRPRWPRRRPGQGA
jgi:hypothetical protein